jgi:hypothetical protein
VNREINRCETFRTGTKNEIPVILCVGGCARAANHKPVCPKGREIGEAREPEAVESFTQLVPDLVSGTYAVRWYEPQTGDFLAKSTQATVDEDGTLSLSVPSFVRDLACLITLDK